MQWLLLYTKRGLEKKVSESLTRKKIENYFPIAKNLKNPGVYRLLETPLFPTYILTKTKPADFYELKKITGIVNLVYWLGNPAIISDDEVKSLRQFLLEHINIKVEKMAIASKVQNLNDTSENNNGQDLAINKDLIINKTANISLPSLGYLITGEPATSNVRLVSSKKLIGRPKLAGFKLLNSWGI
jgi:hypothetical protein